MSLDNKPIVSRKFAKENNLDRYFTGVMCKHGHFSERYTKHASCIACLQDYAKKPESIQWMKNHNKARRNNPEFIALEKRIRNTDSSKARKLAYNKTDKMKKWKNEYIKNKTLNDNVYAMKRRLRNLVSTAFNRVKLNKPTRTEEILGCDVDFFRRHIELQFTDGMSWDRFNEIEIDHIIPVDSAKNIEDVIKLNHFTNLRPLWAKDNKSKSNKIEFLI